MKKIIITLGDPDGISPEITIKALNALDLSPEKAVLAANSSILDFYGRKYGLILKHNYEIEEIPFDINALKIGAETKEGGEFSFRALEKACSMLKTGSFSALVTAPVSKNAMKKAGHNFSGQTEIIEHYLAEKGQQAEMVFFCGNFYVMLITRHIALKDVPESIKKEALIERIEKLSASFERQLNVKNPAFALCALNPHAGEGGMFGREEIEEIIPAVNELKQKGINIEGPFPADTIFKQALSKNNKYSCFAAMYHDQGLIPVKLTGMQQSVNVTMGLNYLRTSPAHGTAFDIAGQNAADPSGMISALKLASGAR